MNIFELAEKLTSNEFSFDKTKCLRTFKDSKCNKCVSVCPNNSLSIKDENIRLSLEKCSACSLCITTCPSKAFSFSLDINKMLMEKINDDATSIFSCVKSKQKSSYKVKCLAMLEESTLINFVLKKGSALVITDECNSCPISAQALPIIIEKIKLSNNLLSIIGKKSSAKINVMDKAVLIENYLSRKDLFKKISSKIKIEPINGEPSEKKHDNKALTNNHKLLIEIIKKNIPLETAEVMPLPFYQIKINKNCNYCQKCTKLCPTGALYGGVENKKVKIFYKMKDCNGCNLCVEVCEKKCVEVSSKVQINNLNKEATLFISDAKLCNKCGEVISIDVESCGHCLKKEVHNKNITTIFG